MIMRMMTITMMIVFWIQNFGIGGLHSSLIRLDGGLHWFQFVNNHRLERKTFLKKKITQVCQNWGPENTQEKTTACDSEDSKTKDKSHNNGQERTAQKENGSPKTTSEVSPKTSMEGNPENLEKDSDKSSKEEDPCHQGHQGQGQCEDEDPRRARLSGLSLTLGRGAVPRALRFLV